MADAATRLYERNYQWHVAHDSSDDERALLATMQGGSGRYTQAYAHLKAHPGLDVLELGCGSPSMARIFGPLTRSYTMIDIVEARVGGEVPPNARTICANLDNEFPVESAAFDVVHAMMVIEHLYDPFHAFAELARVIKPGGIAFINLPNIASIRCRLALLLGRLPQTSTPDWFARNEWDGGHLHYFTVATVKQVAEFAGFELVAVEPVGRHAAIKKLRPQLLCHEINFTLRKTG